MYDQQPQDYSQSHMSANSYQLQQTMSGEDSRYSSGDSKQYQDYTTQDSYSGPSRQSQASGSNRMQPPSTSTQGPRAHHHQSQHSQSRPGPYSRPPAPDYSSFKEDSIQQHQPVKASSTTSEFTKRKNWSQHIVDEIQDFMHVLSPTGEFMFVSPSIRELTSWSPEDLHGRSITSFIHADDAPSFVRDFHESLSSGTQLNLYYRFRMKDDRYTIFEIAGHAYYLQVGEDGAQQEVKCFFGIGRPYPSKNTAMLDSFLQLKMENERLRQELQIMYKDIEAGQFVKDRVGDQKPNINSPDAFSNAQPLPTTSRDVIDPGTGLVQTTGLIPSSSNMYGALGIGISTSGKEGSGDKKKKKARPDDGEFVCRDCGTVDSPEWRKGPEGPKSLCNACGLRYAKLKSKEKDKTKQENAK